MDSGPLGLFCERPAGRNGPNHKLLESHWRGGLPRIDSQAPPEQGMLSGKDGGKGLPVQDAVATGRFTCYDDRWAAGLQCRPRDDFQAL